MILLIFVLLTVVYFVIRQIILSYRLRNVPSLTKSNFGDGLSCLFTLFRFRSGSKAATINETAYQILIGMSSLFREGMCLLWMGPMPHILIISAEAAEPILTNNKLLCKSTQYEFFSPLVGTGLLNGSGEKWRYHRKLLTPAFHFKILDQSLNAIRRNGKILVVKLLKESLMNHGMISNLQQTILLCTLDVICETAMNNRINAQSDPEAKYVKAGHELALMTMDRICKPWLYPDFIYYRTATGKKYISLINFMHSFDESIIATRQQEMHQELIAKKSIDRKGYLTTHDEHHNRQRKREPFIDTLISEHLSRPEQFTYLDVRDEAANFMGAGHHTTGWCVTWTTYLLGLHPEIQQRLQQEVDSLFEDRDPSQDLTINELKSKLPYTEAVVKESLRLYPPIPMFGRLTDREVSIAGHRIPAGVTLMVNVLAMHRDPKHWQQPEKFIPERFLGQPDMHPFSFIPFSAGPRNCIGQKLAMLEAKALVAEIFRNFKITSLDQRYELSPSLSVTLLNDSPIRIRLESRSE